MPIQTSRQGHVFGVEGRAAGLRDFPRRSGMLFGIGTKPRLAATSRARRAIVDARDLDPALGEAALRALQLMQFTARGLLDEDDDLRSALAAVPGLLREGRGRPSRRNPNTHLRSAR